MWIKESMDKLEKIRDSTAAEGNYNARVTFDNILGVMYRACTIQCKEWAKHTELIIEKVLGGYYTGTYEEACKFLNQLSKNKKINAQV